MARPSNTDERRKALVPVVAHTFAELGYRRTTTAVLARRCEVQENILYRLWADKKAMFIAAIEYVYEMSVAIWRKMLQAQDDGRTTAERLLAYEAEHFGEFGHYRIVFAGLSETDDPDIRAALADMYRRYHRFIQREIRAHREERGCDGAPEATLAAWAVIGLGTVTGIARELTLLGDRQRRRAFGEIGRTLLEGATD
ncbi:MAG: TetR/AcrR family transcriptional regulator [Phycisphaerae bacterium]